MTVARSDACVAVVDDDHGVLVAIGNLLEACNHRPHLFESAEALLASPYLDAVDCLISDIDMPGMDGFELLLEAKARRPGLPVILITGQSNKLNLPPPPGLPLFTLLKKPFSGNELLSALGHVLPPES